MVGMGRGLTITTRASGGDWSSRSLRSAGVAARISNAI
jgi:hypothetical protein